MLCIKPYINVGVIYYLDLFLYNIIFNTNIYIKNHVSLSLKGRYLYVSCTISM